MTQYVSLMARLDQLLLEEPLYKAQGNRLNVAGRRKGIPQSGFV